MNDGIKAGLLKTDPHVGAKCRRGRGRWWRIVALIVVTVLFFLSTEFIYAVLYIRRCSKINTEHGSGWVKASELPENCAKYVETHGCPLDEAGEVRVRYYDIDGDGIDELLTDAGDLGRGAANSWWAIWQKRPSGAYRCLGTFFCNQFNFVPPWYIYGMPAIWCSFDSQDVWVPWKDGRYDGEDSNGKTCSIYDEVGEDGESHDQK